MLNFHPISYQVEESNILIREVYGRWIIEEEGWYLNEDLEWETEVATDYTLEDAMKIVEEYFQKLDGN